MTAWDMRLGDCLDPVTGLASLAPGAIDVVITDPVWPNRPETLWPDVDAEALFARMCSEIERLRPRRMVVHLGCDTDPRMLEHVPRSLPFVRVCWLRRTPPGYRGTVLYTSDVAYVFGDRRGPFGATVMPGECQCPSTGAKEVEHPCPRNRAGVEWLVRWFTDPGEVVCDPFAGSGTTGAACVSLGRRFLGWEIDPVFHEAARRRLANTREQLELARPAAVAKQERLL